MSIIVSMILTYLILNSAIQDDTMFLDYAMDKDLKIKRIMFFTQSCAPSVHERTTFNPLQETYFFTTLMLQYLLECGAIATYPTLITKSFTCYI